MLELDENMLYREVILEHYKNPHNTGLKKDLPVSSAKNPTCGDSVMLQIDFDKDVITSVYQSGKGCSISVSSASILSDLLILLSKKQAIYLIENFLKMAKGENYDEKLDFKDAVVYKSINNYPARYKCVAVVWELALKIIKGENIEK